MSTNLANPANTTAKVRWREQYVSQGINEKMNGVVPAGVLRGGKLGTSLVNLSVTIEADPDTNDSVYSHINANGQQVTFRQQGDVTLNLSGVVSTTVFIGLDVIYAVSATTDVYWRAYSQAEIDADPTIIVLGMVDVPASGLIPASDIYPTERREAWTGIAPHLREWRQALTNGSFETCKAAQVTAGDQDIWPDWDVQGSFGLWNNIDVWVQTGTVRTGDRALLFDMTGVAGQQAELYWAGQFKVVPGQLVQASVYAKAVSMTASPTMLGMTLYFLSRTGANLGSVDISNVTLGTDFDWTEITGIAEVPANAVSMWASIRYDDNNQNSTGQLFFDDARVWLETGPATDEYPGRDRDDHFGGSLRSYSLDLPPMPPGASNMTTLLDRMIRMRQLGSISPLEVLMGARDGSTPFDLNLQHGGIKIPRVIEELGTDLIGNNSDALTARATIPFADETDAEYTLLASIENPTAEYNMRLYAAESSGLQQFPSLVVTHNAFWNGSVWNYDNSGRAAVRRDWGYAGSAMYKRDSGGGTWADSGWTDGISGSQLHTHGQSPFGIGLQAFWNLGGGSGVGGAQGFGLLFDAILGWYDTTVGASGSNPAYDDVVAGNTLVAKNVVKAWLNFGWSSSGGGTAFNYDGFNLELVSVGQYMQFVFGTPMQDDQYAIVWGDRQKTSPTTLWHKIYDSDVLKLTTGFDATLLEFNETGPAINEIWFNTTFGVGSVVVLGRQDT